MLTERVIQRILQGPPRSTVPLVDDAWPSVLLDGPHGPYRVHMNLRSGPAPVVVAIHGWTSGVAHARNRTEVLTDHGFHVVLLEMVAHGTSTYDGDFTAQCVVECLEHLLDELKQGTLSIQTNDQVVLHGHSLGAYVALGSTKGRHRDNVRALLLESPMTCYSPILLDALEKIPVLKKSIVRRLIKRWNIMHRNLKISNLEDVDVPRWGVPHVPVFVMQADPDLRLGKEHLDVLIEATPSDLIDVWRSNTLRHSGTSSHEERDKALMRWLRAADFIPRC